MSILTARMTLRHLQTLPHVVHPSVAQKHENLTAPDQYRRGGGEMGDTVKPNLAIASWVCNVCQTQTPFSQTTTAALSVGRPCTYTHVRNKYQCCYLSIFTLLSLFWNEKKKCGVLFSEQPSYIKILVMLLFVEHSVPKCRRFFSQYLSIRINLSVAKLASENSLPDSSVAAINDRRGANI